MTKHEVEVQFKVIQVFSSVNIAKTFWIKDFFEDYSVKSTKNKNQRIFYSIHQVIQSIKLFQKYDLIESNYKIIFNGFLLDTDVLTSKNISEGFVIYEKLSV